MYPAQEGHWQVPTQTDDDKDVAVPEAPAVAARVPSARVGATHQHVDRSAVMRRFVERRSKKMAALRERTGSDSAIDVSQSLHRAAISKTRRSRDLIRLKSTEFPVLSKAQPAKSRQLAWGDAAQREIEVRDVSEAKETLEPTRSDAETTMCSDAAASEEERARESDAPTGLASDGADQDGAEHPESLEPSEGNAHAEESAASDRECALEVDAAIIAQCCMARDALLRARFLADANPPEEIRTLVAEAHPLGLQASAPSKGRTFDRSMFGSKAQPKEQLVLTQSANAYKIAKSSEEMSREQQLRREVNSLLNKVCPDNLEVIVGHVANTEVQSVAELELLITLIFKKALAEPHYCETYADMVEALRQRVPEFEAKDGGKPITFKAVLLNATQTEFESLADVLRISPEELSGLDLEEIEYLKKKRKDRVLANMKFIGNLFLRKLLSSKILSAVIRDLAGCEDEQSVPEEPMVECLCELITSIGFTLEETPAGRAAIVQVVGRLKELKSRKEDGRSLYCKRVQFTIQDVLDCRDAGWQKKSFKAAAKTKDEIRQQQEQELKAPGKGKRAEVQIAGARKVTDKPDKDGEWQVAQRR